MKANPLVSVVTVTYNAEFFLEETIKSVMAQDYPNIEYIIIDGGSKDGTTDIIKKYEKYIDYWVSEADSGIYEAMNKGIEKATGKWINFMNAGDSFCDSRILSKVFSVDTKTDDIICGNIYYIDENEKKLMKPKGLYDVFNGMFCFHQATFCKLDLLNKYKFSTEFKISGDYDFMLKCYMNDYKFKFIDLAVANFKHGGIAETNVIKARIEDMFIESKYMNQLDEIFKHNSYMQLQVREGENNKVFSVLLNRLYTQLKKIDFSNKKVLLYGFGHIGQLIHGSYATSIVSIVDKEHLQLTEKTGVEVKSLAEISNIEYSHILISVLSREEEIIKYLQGSFNIEQSKIIRVCL